MTLFDIDLKEHEKLAGGRYVTDGDIVNVQINAYGFWNCFTFYTSLDAAKKAKKIYNKMKWKPA